MTAISDAATEYFRSEAAELGEFEYAGGAGVHGEKVGDGDEGYGGRPKVSLSLGITSRGCWTGGRRAVIVDGRRCILNDDFFEDDYSM
jgi:hypothetical protein